MAAAKTPRSRGREVACGVLHSSPKTEKGLFLPSDRDRDFLSSVFYTPAPKIFSYQTPGPRPPNVIGRRVNTVTRGCVGAPHERAPFRFHDAVVGFVDRRLSRTRNLAASN